MSKIINNIKKLKDEKQKIWLEKEDLRKKIIELDSKENKIDALMYDYMLFEIQNKIPLKKDFIIDIDSYYFLYNFSSIEKVTIWDEKISFSVKNCTQINLWALEENYYEETTLVFKIDNIDLIQKIKPKQKNKILEILEKNKKLKEDIKLITKEKQNKSYEFL